MEDTWTLLFLLSIIAFFIGLYVIIKFVFIKKRSFTFEIINIPLGIFKFDKRDEYIKENNYDKISSKSLDNSNIKIENNENCFYEGGSNHEAEKQQMSLTKNNDKLSNENNKDIVYWTASGKVYHTSKKCRTLSRSKVIFNGTIEDSGRYHECIHCQ